MDKPIAKLSRQNHIDHIIGVLPLITAVFGVQCYLMSQFTSGIEIGNLALGLASGLVAFVGGLFYYDNKHQVFVYPDRLRAGFGLLGGLKSIKFSEIEEVIAPLEEKKFASIILRMKNNRSHIFYFVDYPLDVKKLLDHQKALFDQEADSDDSFAA